MAQHSDDPLAIRYQVLLATGQRKALGELIDEWAEDERCTSRRLERQLAKRRRLDRERLRAASAIAVNAIAAKVANFEGQAKVERAVEHISCASSSTKQPTEGGGRKTKPPDTEQHRHKEKLKEKLREHQTATRQLYNQRHSSRKSRSRAMWRS